ncbi:MAG TPA: HDOD domain-containing protein, partial [Bryobacteraceae bacterium]
MNRLLPADNALAAHCRRVSSLAAEIAREVSLSLACTSLLQEAARLHHFPALLLDPGSLDRLLPDILASGSGPTFALAGSNPVVPSEVATVQRMVHCRFHGPADPQLSRVAAILQLSDLLDEQIEPLVYEEFSPSGIWEGLEQIAEFTLFDRKLLQDARRALTAAPGTFAASGFDLAPHARAAREVFSALAFQRDFEIGELVRLANSDAVFAGHLMQVANSAIYSPKQRLASVRRAIMYVGTEKTRKIMLAVALEPTFAGDGMHGLWKHSLRAAQLCEALALSTGIMDPEEALLLGLVHDIGRQATQKMVADRQPTRERLLSGGCPLTYGEKLLFGRDHGEVGAEVLTSWNFPRHLTEAVRYHHRPEA